MYSLAAWSKAASSGRQSLVMASIASSRLPAAANSTMWAATGPYLASTWTTCDRSSRSRGVASGAAATASVRRFRCAPIAACASSAIFFADSMSAASFTMTMSRTPMARRLASMRTSTAMDSRSLMPWTKPLKRASAPARLRNATTLTSTTAATSAAKANISCFLTERAFMTCP
jgi:hypothetical protein